MCPKSVSFPNFRFFSNRNQYPHPSQLSPLKNGRTSPVWPTIPKEAQKFTIFGHPLMGLYICCEKFITYLVDLNIWVFGVSPPDLHDLNLFSAVFWILLFRGKKSTTTQLFTFLNAKRGVFEFKKAVTFAFHVIPRLLHFHVQHSRHLSLLHYFRTAARRCAQHLQHELSSPSQGFSMFSEFSVQGKYSNGTLLDLWLQILYISLFSWYLLFFELPWDPYSEWFGGCYPAHGFSCLCRSPPICR